MKETGIYGRRKDSFGKIIFHWSISMCLGMALQGVGVESGAGVGYIRQKKGQFWENYISLEYKYVFGDGIVRGGGRVRGRGRVLKLLTDQQFLSRTISINDVFCRRFFYIVVDYSGYCQTYGMQGLIS
eukprot:TRINITY_DN12949_c2_g1_i6.p1 TRINITY_DN12949_c2_g1~~TRINITY_DN12949_c2_g1_i6.p1  ORF type:complete len:128 (-),score=6.44 TRINITY_DN12949_c2_g1_i6:67-450(-)